MSADSKPISRRVVTPADCVFCVGIPVTVDSFDRAQTIQGKEYGRSMAPAKYEYLVVESFKPLREIMIATGVELIEECTLAQFIDVLSRQRPVTILCSHWREELIEFADGMRHADEILTQFPRNFRAFLDLTICHPTSLARELQATRPDGLVKFTNGVATPSIWFAFYQLVFAALALGDRTYLDALQTARRLLLEGGAE